MLPLDPTQPSKEPSFQETNLTSFLKKKTSQKMMKTNTQSGIKKQVIGWRLEEMKWSESLNWPSTPSVHWLDYGRQASAKDKIVRWKEGLGWTFRYISLMNEAPWDHSHLLLTGLAKDWFRKLKRRSICLFRDLA